MGEVATAVRAESNVCDCYAVAILEADTYCSVEHLPHQISKVCYYLLRMDGDIEVEVTELRGQSDLPQGGLEVLCIMTLEHKEDKMVKKA